MKTGVIIDSFRCDFKNAVKLAREVGAEGVQIGARFLTGNRDEMAGNFSGESLVIPLSEAKKILSDMFDDKSIDPEAYAKEKGYIVSNDTGLIEKVVAEVIASDSKAVADFKGGKEKALMSLFGRCMKELRGNCDPQVLRTILIDAINKM